MGKYILMVCLMLPVFASAQNPASIPAAAAVSAPVAAPAVSSGDKAVSSLQGLYDKIPASIPAWFIAICVFLRDLALRLKPTMEPKSLLIVVAKIFGLIGSIFSKLSAMLDLLLQNLKEPPGPKV